MYASGPLCNAPKRQAVQGPGSDRVLPSLRAGKIGQVKAQVQEADERLRVSGRLKVASDGRFKGRQLD